MSKQLPNLGPFPSADFERTPGLTPASDEREWRRKRKPGQRSRTNPSFIKTYGLRSYPLGRPNSGWDVIGRMLVETPVGYGESQSFVGCSMCLSTIYEVMEIGSGWRLLNLHGGIFVESPDGERMMVREEDFSNQPIEGPLPLDLRKP